MPDIKKGKDVPESTLGEEHKGRGDANPGGALSRDPDFRHESVEDRDDLEVQED